MGTITKELLKIRKKLLDLSMRNRFLNYRPTKSRTLNIIDVIPREIYNILVNQENSMKFLPLEKVSDEVKNLFKNEQMDISSLSENDFLNLWSDSESNISESDRYNDIFLQTGLDKISLQKKLFYIHHQANSILEEQGFSVLFIALGFLEWQESNDSQFRKAPLIMIPVELERSKVKSSFKLKWTGEDIQENISLKAKLSEQGHLLPELNLTDNPDSIDDYFENIENQVSEYPNWSVSREIFLDFFSFSKFVMYKDLDPDSWPDDMDKSDKYKLIQSLLGTNQNKNSNSEGLFEEDMVDKKLKSSEIFQVHDADSSQIAVIEDAKSGRNIVVQGPPGTGKSQTITNIIAELLVKDKKVLFISEKMAALEVVSDRLNDAGLGAYCLEVHSRKTSRKSVLNELDKSLTLTDYSFDNDSLEAKMARLDKLRKELNNYVSIISNTYSSINIEPIKLLSIIESSRKHFEKVERNLVTITANNWNKFDIDEFESAIEKLNAVRGIIESICPVTDNPWNGCFIDDYLPNEEPELKLMIENCSSSFELLKDNIEKLKPYIDFVSETTIEVLREKIRAFEFVTGSIHINVNDPTNYFDKDTLNSATSLIDKLIEYRDHSSSVHDLFTEDSLDFDIENISNEYKEFAKRNFRIFNGRYRYLKKQINSFYKEESSRDINTIISDLEKLTFLRNLRNSIRDEKSKRSGDKCFGSYWKEEKSQIDLLQKYFDWIKVILELIDSDCLDKNVVGCISIEAKREKLIEDVKDLNVSIDSFFKKLDILINRLKFDPEVRFQNSISNVPLDSIFILLNTWLHNLSELNQWSIFSMLIAECKNTLAKPIAVLIENDKLISDDIIPCFKANYAEKLLSIVYKEKPFLRNFIGINHEKKIEEFATLDKDLLNLNRKRLIKNLNNKTPKIFSGATPNSEIGFLLAEIGRKRNHIPLRRLFEKSGKYIQKLKPCFMMSPLSVAQFISPESIRFDVVIIDEASQIKPEDALGSFLRADQAIIMGDTKQLPPTSFFDHLIDSDDYDDDDDSLPAGDQESILHLCRGVYPTKTLKWHYRSRHESLIAVSNLKFYNNELVIFPSANQKMDELGLQFVHLPETIYDRGRSSINRLEAREIAKRVVEHYKKTTP